MDPAAALERLCDAGAELTSEDLQALLVLVHAALGEIEAASRKRKQQVVLGAALLATMEQMGSGDELADLACLQRLAQHVHEWQLDNPFQPGRGYSLFPRAPPKLRIVQDRVAQLRATPLTFRQEFGLTPSEFDHLFGAAGHNIAALIGSLPNRAVSPENRLAMVLRHWRSDIPMDKNAEWFGTNKTSGGEDLNAITDGMFESAHSASLAGEISWPTQAERDQEVIRVAQWQPGLAGAHFACDHKHRQCDQRGRTTGQPNLHKVDYHGKKGHGRNIFLCCRISDGKIIYIDYNRGGRGEATCYRDYDIYRNGHRYHTVRPRLLIDRVPTGSAASFHCVIHRGCGFIIRGCDAGAPPICLCRFLG